jgi:hypothetical protein
MSATMPARYRRVAAAFGGWLLAVLPYAFLETLRLLVGAPFDLPGSLGRLVFVAGLLALAGRLPLYACLALALAAAALYALLGLTLAAWALAFAWLLLLLRLEWPLSAGLRWWLAWPIRLLLAGLAGGALAALGQIESRFSDEEFFVALEALALSMFWLLLCIAARGWQPRNPPRPGSPLPFPRSARPFLRSAAVIGVFGLSVAGGVATVLAYQRSFFPPEAPVYPGIDAENPLICGRVLPGPGSYDGGDVFRRLLARVEANINKGAPEHGLLALGSGDAGWAQSFRTTLLAEARAGLFTGSAGSLKYVQRLAATRAYYYVRVRERFPELFSPEEEAELRAWFRAINGRALQVELVDWMYALAFRKLPEGPYENQESGAGLLALLEAGGLADPALAAANRDYLARNQRGWQARFRNTDDAPIYQPEWIRNALLQAEYTGALDAHRRALSFEWLLAQALPDGAPLRQNHPGILTMADSGYLAAALLDDPRFLWLAGRSLDRLEALPRYLTAEVAGDLTFEGVGSSPTTGSCLIYGDSGLPNQPGPLAPDKLVLRDGWDDGSTYLMLNLRFSGWHRYKATGTLALLYQGGPLAVEQLAGQRFAWLPEGRSLFRDKRLPRENLNGLVIARSGLSAVRYALSGIGGPWAQDPPFYATVERFELGEGRDAARVRVDGWHGWTQHRELTLYHGGPAVIVDRAQGPAGVPAALRWHLRSELPHPENLRRVRLRSGPNPAELVSVPLAAGEPWLEAGAGGDLGADFVVSWPAAADGRLEVATVLLRGQWVGAAVEAVERAEGRALRITAGERELVVPL